MKILLPILSCVFITLISCEKEKIDLKNYFPLVDGTEWCYGNYYEGEPLPFLAATWKIQGDTTLDGKVYKELNLFDQPYKIIREENGEFFKRKVSGFGTTTGYELLFLKTNDADGATWEQLIGTDKYVISQEVIPELTLNGELWKDVIKVTIQIFYTNLDGEFEAVLDPETNEPAAARYNFANGTGLISLYEPFSFTHFSDFSYATFNSMEIMECQ